MKIELDLPEIEGFEYTGEYRIAEPGEYILIHDYTITAQGRSSKYPILKKKAPKYKLLSHKQSIKDDDVIEYVEIKALEEAVKLIGGRILNFADTRIYDELKSLIS